jgi:hypothetical protein
VRRKAANRVTIYCWRQRQCGVQLVSTLGSVVISVSDGVGGVGRQPPRTVECFVRRHRGSAEWAGGWPTRGLHSAYTMHLGAQYGGGGKFLLAATKVRARTADGLGHGPRLAQPRRPARVGLGANGH